MSERKERKYIPLAERWQMDENIFVVEEDGAEKEIRFSKGNLKKAHEFTIAKTEPDKMLVFGWGNVAVDADGNQIVDLQGDTIDPEELEKAAYDHVLNFRNTGERHDPGMRKKGRLVESCVFTKEKQAAIGIPLGIVPEGWWVGYKIDDQDAWEKIKKGEYQSFSIDGKGERTPVEKARERTAKSYADLRKFNPYHDSRGRFSTSNGYASFTSRTKDPKKQHWADAAIAREKKRQAATTAAPAKPAQPKAKVTRDALGFADHDDADYHDLYNGSGYYKQQKLDATTKQALSSYLDPDEEPGSLYSFNQNMNHAVLTGTINQQPRYKKVFDQITSKMHNLGYNVNLTRYDHGEFLDDRLAGAGIRGGHAGMSVAQLKKMLVGQQYGDPRILSTSYNNFKNASASSHQVFTTREVKITYKAKAGAKALMPGDGPGGKFGEMLLSPANKYKIVDIKLSGNKARAKGQPRSNMNLNQIEVVVEVE